MVEVCVVADFYDVFANHGDCFNKDKKNLDTSRWRVILPYTLTHPQKKSGFLC
jgi:hypothetical protein